MDLRCLPADLHLRPGLIPDAVEAAVAVETAKEFIARKHNQMARA